MVQVILFFSLISNHPMIVRQWLVSIYYSFPVQLLLLQLRNHLLLIVIWILLTGLMTGTIANSFGVKYLFWAPEYLGTVDFWSFAFLGFAFAGFCMTWNLTVYMLDAFRFPFLASLKRPLTKFCYNNFIIPLLFVSLLIYYQVSFEISEEHFSWENIIYNLLGFILGAMTLVIILLVYFAFTNKDILSYERQFEQNPPNLLENLAPGRAILIENMQAQTRAWPVRNYLTETLKPRPVRSVAHYSQATLMSVFRQNHFNALAVQSISLALLVLLGMLVENPYFRIPAGASIFLLFSALIAMIGAIIYWFNHWSMPVFLLLFFIANTLTKQGFFSHVSQAYGLNYEKAGAIYDFESLQNNCASELIAADIANTIEILDNWKAKTGQEKPKMLLQCVSGGGLRAAAWAMQVLRTSDKETEGSLMRNTVLMSGASGGMIALAYFRELEFLARSDTNLNPYALDYVRYVSKDLLNSVAFTIVTNDMFLPLGSIQIGERKYDYDRGYMFERQLNENTHFILDKKISDYKQLEQSAEIPMLFITPYILNDARRFIISPQAVSYMTIAPIGVQKDGSVDIDAIDLQNFFAQQDADSLHFTTALRMNATYPYVLPAVSLPTQTEIKVMDAGFRDNHGLKSAMRFVQVFKDWIQENTSGVAIILVRSDERKTRQIESVKHDGILNSLLDPLGIVGQILSLQDYEHDNSIGFLYELLGEDMFEVIEFTYQASLESEKASMTFHLTDRERKDILSAIHLPQNQESLERLKSILSE